jgi:hypothetical protein
MRRRCAAEVTMLLFLFCTTGASSRCAAELLRLPTLLCFSLILLEQAKDAQQNWYDIKMLRSLLCTSGASSRCAAKSVSKLELYQCLELSQQSRSVVHEPRLRCMF